MPIASSNIIESIKWPSNVGKKTMLLLTFFEQHKDKELAYFAKLAERGEISKSNLSRLFKAFSYGVRREINDVDNDAFKAEAMNTFVEQFRKWDTLPHVIGEVQWSDGPWIMAQEWSDTQNPTPAEKITESLKAINCLCRFYFGDDLLPNVKPAEEYIPITLADIKDTWAKAQKPEADLAQEELVQLKHWEAGFLQCDLRR